MRGEAGGGAVAVYISTAGTLTDRAVASAIASLTSTLWPSRKREANLLAPGGCLSSHFRHMSLSSITDCLANIARYIAIYGQPGSRIPWQISQYIEHISDYNLHRD